jgi:hypothetical protein
MNNLSNDPSHTDAPIPMQNPLTRDATNHPVSNICDNNRRDKHEATP